MREPPGRTRKLREQYDRLMNRFARFCWACISMARARSATGSWFRSSFLPSQNYLIILSVVVGVLTGLGSVIFIYLLAAVNDFAQGTLAVHQADDRLVLRDIALRDFGT